MSLVSIETAPSSAWTRIFRWDRQVKDGPKARRLRRSPILDLAIPPKHEASMRSTGKCARSARDRFEKALSQPRVLRTRITAHISGLVSSRMEITARQIGQWAGSKDAQAALPRYIRRLIHGAGSITQIAAQPAIPGDGELTSEHGNAWVPKGKSFWEMSCDAQVTSKGQQRLQKANGQDTRAHPKGKFTRCRHWKKVAPKGTVAGGPTGSIGMGSSPSVRRRRP